jgi:hypothetical protein
VWRADEIVQIASRPSMVHGSFGIPGTVKPDGRIECQKWETCRDRFFTSGANLKIFWYRIGNHVDGQNVSAFFDKIETILKVKKKSNFGPTSCEGAIWVRWAPFWRKYSMRRSLFTALLRQSVAYNRDADNYEAVLNKTEDYRYLSYTRPAFDHFMQGHTVYTGEGNRGWQNVFYNKPQNSLGPLLRKPMKPATA